MAHILTYAALQPLFDVADVTGQWSEINRLLLDASDGTRVQVTPEAFAALANASRSDLVCRYNDYAWRLDFLFWPLEGAWLKIEVWHGACHSEEHARSAIAEALKPVI